MLKINNLKTRYGFIEAIKGISLHIKKGEIVTLIGSNGAGKTTTLNTIAGLLKPIEGTILLNEQPIHGLPPHKIVQYGLSLVPEGRRVFPELSVRKNLFLGAFTRKLSNAELQQELENVYKLFPIMGQRQTQAAGTLSGGEQQMLAIGRALMAKPSILLLDEPSMGLAPLVVRDIFRTITEIREVHNITIFLVEQNARMALSIADRGYVMETGKIVLEGTSTSLKDDSTIKKAYLGIKSS